jgi:hypothetical protein
VPEGATTAVSGQTVCPLGAVGRFMRAACTRQAASSDVRAARCSGSLNDASPLGGAQGTQLQRCYHGAVRAVHLDVCSMCL